MADYIRREDATLAVRRYAKNAIEKKVKELDVVDDVVDDVVNIVEELERVPAADVAEVVRCKDCRYLGKKLDKGLYSCDDYNLPYCEPDSYCSHGRRKEDAKHAAD